MQSQSVRAGTFALFYSLLFGLIALGSMIVFLIFPHDSWIRGNCAGIGGVSAPQGVGIGAWAAIRLRSRVHLLAAIPGSVAFVGWCWLIYATIKTAAG